MSRHNPAWALALVLIALTAARPLRAAESTDAAAPAAASQPGAAASRMAISDAERIVRLEEAIRYGEEELAALKEQLDDPNSEYAQAKAEFSELDKRLKELEKALKQAAGSQPAESQPAADTAARGTEDLLGQIDSVRKRWTLAKERFDLAIKQDAAEREKLATLEKKLQQDREALTKLRTPEPAASQPAAAILPPAAPPSEVTAESMAPLPAATAAPEEASSSKPAGQGAAPAPAAQPSSTAAAPPAGQPPAAQAAAPPAAPPAPTAPPAPAPLLDVEKKTPPSKELVEAQQAAQAKKAQAVKAEEEVQSLSERIATLRGNIKTENDLLETASKKAANAQETRDLLRAEIQSKLGEGAPVDEVNRLWQKADQAEQRSTQARDEVNEHIQRLEELRVELDGLQADHIAALEQAERKLAEAREAESKVRQLENPFAPLNMLQWLLDHGPRIVGIVLSMMVLWWLTRLAEGRIASFIARGNVPDRSALEREGRARTLASVFRTVASTVIVVGSALMILTEIGINVLPLLGGAAVIGLAVAFGAQALIKDYFSGFIILLENQYAINDVIKIGETAGLVERITLRMTVLRDLEGNAHFIPHGEVKQVTNMTHGWSRAVFAIGVAYKEPVDRVMQVLMDLSEELCEDPKFHPLILDKPQMLGVDTFGDSEVVIKFMIKTRPLQQWAVKRELLRRIKNRFDELGIEIPFPHRTVYHRYEADGTTATPPPISPAGRSAGGGTIPAS